jgi:L-alanine-DL-glutamate epimerase-like enolase superfamily enzyme
VRIERIETYHFQEAGGSLRLDHFIWVRIVTDAGVSGVGETTSLPRAVAAVIHDLYAPILLGADPQDISYLWAEMYSAAQFAGAGGTEIRALSALDVALWDIAGQIAGQPLYRLLGGQCHDRVRAYNTGLNAGAYPDLDTQDTDPAGLARQLRADGFTAMKVWPFDQFAPRSRFRLAPQERGNYWAFGPIGQSLSKRELQVGLDVLARIRDAVGDEMDIAIEGHGRWNLPTAVAIARALEPYEVMWLEDAIPTDSVADMAALARDSGIPICFSERLFTRWGFREAVQARAMQVVMCDVCWGGGVSEGRNLAVMADTFHLPFVTHGATGPILSLASLHVCMAAPNTLIMEVVRSHLRTWYSDVVTANIAIEDGHLAAPVGDGLGTTLRQDFMARSDIHREESHL